MHTILSLIGIIGAFYLIKNREQIGNMLGEAEWMKNAGGIYTIIVFVAVLIFFWSIAELTGTTNMFFTPLRYLFPSQYEQSPSSI